MNRKNALVIGGSGGIGSEVVRVLASKGFRVAFTYFKNKKAADELLTSQENVTGYPADLLNPDAIQEMVSRMLADHGGLDAIVYSVTPPVLNKNILSTTWQDHLDHWQLQTKGLFHVVQALKERILQKKKLKKF